MLKAFLLAVGLSASSARAATMTFDYLWDYANNDYYSGSVYTEDGITVTGNSELGYWSNTSLVLADFDYPSSSRAVFTMGSRFNAVGFELTPYLFDYFQCDPSGNCTRPTYENVLIQGYRGGNLVASMIFDMGSPLQSYPVQLGFAALDALSIEVHLPPQMTTGLPPGYTWDCNSPCTSFGVDNVTLAPVPLPGAIGLAGAGLAALGLTARRRSKRSA